ncbi:MAG: beta-ketoacyl synthase N-terminal-like domain-containing protein [bacterium]
MTSPRSVVITGIGAHSAGGDFAAAVEVVRTGRSAIAELRDGPFDSAPAIPAVTAGAVELTQYVEDRKLLKYMNLGSKLAVLAAGRALGDAGLASDEASRRDCALFVGTGLISFDLSTVLRALEASTTPAGALDLEALGAEGIRRCHPLLPFQMLLNTPLGLVSIVYSLRGENFIQYPGPHQAGLGLETAFRGIRSGRFPRALVGAGVEQLGLLPLLTMIRRGWVAGAPERAVPFSPEHDGVALADAGAFLVLESAEAAAGRGAAVRGSLSSVNSAYDPGPPQGETLRRLWESTCGDTTPARIVITGSLNRDGDDALRATARRQWPGATPELVSYDGLLGYAGAASPTLTAALACATGASAGPEEFSGSVLVTALDPDGGSTALLIEPSQGVES